MSGPSSSSLLTQGGASKAIGSLSTQRAGRRLPEPTGIQTRNLAIMVANLTEAESSIRDVILPRK